MSTGKFFLIGMLATLSGCSAIDEQYHAMRAATWDTSKSEPVIIPHEDTGLVYRPDSRDLQPLPEASDPTHYHDPLQDGFYADLTHKSLNDYAGQLAMKLMDSVSVLRPDEKIGVASFVRLNHTLNDTTVLGNQLAEYMLGQLQSYGLAVVDFKLSDTVYVTGRGDLVMHRGFQKIATQARMDHILTGTMVETRRGVRVNARIVNVSEHVLVASASIDVPAFMVTSLNPISGTN
ncbi:FlgO family outer membrane protein [Salinimonas chungwhensis]|uniref:FlgO family outer membrane protein n=1 Tax=Salinimonas chungwhensis TaxID=265425 RepID=UPI000380621A|nr:FlgO family outer membrane protein [Salinimonas chungwhensis]